MNDWSLALGSGACFGLLGWFVGQRSQMAHLRIGTRRRAPADFTPDSERLRLIKTALMSRGSSRRPQPA